jgi:hypothetical protein
MAVQIDFSNLQQAFDERFALLRFELIAIFAAANSGSLAPRITQLKCKWLTENRSGDDARCQHPETFQDQNLTFRVRSHLVLEASLEPEVLEFGAYPSTSRVTFSKTLRLEVVRLNEN